MVRIAHRSFLATPIRALLGLCVVAALVGAPQAGRAAPSAAAVDGVFVEPLPTASLWVGSLDPALTTDAEVTQLIYSGLLKQAYNDKTGHFDIVPDLAAGLPTVSKNGLVYTFHIRPDAAFSDGAPVTAQDFVYSYSRVLNPKTKSWATYYLDDILGASGFSAGKAPTVTGLKALDDHTLRITLWHAASYFLYALTYVTGSVVKPDLAIGAPVTTDPSLVIGAGPWELKNQTWKYRSQISLVPNPYYPGAKNFKLKELDLVFTGSVQTNLAGYKSGQFPMTWLPSADVAPYRGTPEFHESPTLGDVFYVMNLKVAPFTNLHFRRAVSYAIDHEALTKGVDHGAVQSLYCWYPRGIVGFRDDCQAQFPSYNPTRAKQELALALADLKTIPSIQLEYESDNPDRAREAEEVQVNLKAVGITIGLHPAPRATWLKDGFTGKVQFIQSSWIADYADPQDFSDYILKSGAGSNWGNYSNPKVDALFAKAAVASNTATRAKLYEQAQAIIMNDAPVAMGFQFAAQNLISAKYHGIELNPAWANWPQPVGNNWANVSVTP